MANEDEIQWTRWAQPREQGMIVNADLWEDMTTGAGIDLSIRNVLSFNNQDSDHDFGALKNYILQDLYEMKQRLIDIQQDNIHIEGRHRWARVVNPVEGQESDVKSVDGQETDDEDGKPASVQTSETVVAAAVKNDE